MKSKDETMGIDTSLHPFFIAIEVTWPSIFFDLPVARQK